MRITIEEAIVQLKMGEVVAIPTETVYGLAADARNPSALQKIYAIKERPLHNPLIVHIASSDQVLDWAEEFPPLAQALAAAFWPGPLTLVLNVKAEVSKILTAGQSTVALRVPNHPMTLALLQQSGLALAAPSANKYTQLSPTTATHVETGLGAQMAVLDGGACKVGIESTIVHVFQADNLHWQWQVLRQGMVSEAAIKLIAKIPATVNAHKNETPKVPGQHVLHYSPKTPLSLLPSKAAIIEQVKLLKLSNIRCAALLFEEATLALTPDCAFKTLPKNATLYAEHLYATLHALDHLNVQQLFVERPPAAPEWWPILDRLSRAEK